MTDQPTQETDADACPESSDGKHEPNWKTLQINDDGIEIYLDVSCTNCGRSGCVHSFKRESAEVDW